MLSHGDVSVFVHYFTYKRGNKTIMPAPAIAFALVQLVAVVVRGALLIEKKTAASAAASKLKGLISNTSSVGYDITCYEANHGKWTKKPDKELHSIEDAIHDCVSEAKVALGPSATAQQITDWVTEHVQTKHPDQHDKELVAKNHTEFGGEGSGVGTEIAMILTDKRDPDSRIVLMTRHLAGGDYGAGISMSYGPWFTVSKMGINDDDDGSDISDHIQNIHTQYCQFSTGSLVSTSLNGVKVSVKAGQVVLFQIEDV